MEKQKKPNLTKESKKKLKERFYYLAEKLADEEISDEERQKIMGEMTFIQNVMPKRALKELDLSGVFAGIVSFLAMTGAGLVSYKLNNKGLFDKNGSSLINPINFKK